MKLKPIIPFEPVSSNEIPVGKKWISQIKWDGVRIIAYFDGDEIRLFNRRQNERTHHFPELTDISSYCKGDSVILDGEVIALGKNGRPSFHEVMRRDGIRRMDRVKQKMKTVPVYYIIFDITYYNGEFVNNQPLKDRIKLLDSIIKPNQHIQLAKSQQDGETLFEVTKDQGMEGIVSKNLNSPYKFDGKDANWIKTKNFRDIIAVVGGVTYRNGTVNAILLGLYDDKGKLHYIGHAGTGKLTQEEWRALTKYVEPLIINEKPFVNEPEKSKSATWLKPQLTAKIQYIDWPEGRSLRQPSIHAFMDIPPEECRLPSEQRNGF